MSELNTLSPFRPLTATARLRAPSPPYPLVEGAREGGECGLDKCTVSEDAENANRSLTEDWIDWADELAAGWRAWADNETATWLAWANEIRREANKDRDAQMELIAALHEELKCRMASESSSYQSMVH